MPDKILMTRNIFLYAYTNFSSPSDVVLSPILGNIASGEGPLHDAARQGAWMMSGRHPRRPCRIRRCRRREKEAARHEHMIDNSQRVFVSPQGPGLVVVAEILSC